MAGPLEDPQTAGSPEPKVGRHVLGSKHSSFEMDRKRHGALMELYFVRSEQVKEKAVGQDVALYVESQRSIHVLNATARFVWESLKDPMTFDELLFVLTEAFDVDRATLRKDLSDALDRFTEVGLVRTRTADHGDSLP
jgi:hypothetical protein